MELAPYVTQVQASLAAAAALSDERTRQTADALTAAAEPAIRLAVLSAVTAVTDEITAALLDAPGAPAVAVRLDGLDLQVEVRTADPAPDTEAPGAPTTPEDADASARISLRLSEALKADIETAARGDSVSVNTWIVRAASRALTPARATRGTGWDGGERAQGRNPHHITGWING